MKTHTVDKTKREPKRSRRLQNKPPARPNDSLSACERVLATFELLELVLMELRPADILICQRISKSFNDLIANSKQLQRTLCFDPEPPASCGSGFRINPFFGPEVPGVECPLYQSLQTDTLSYPQRSRYRPFQRTFAVEIYVDKETGESKPGLFLKSTSSVSPQPGFVKKASWLRMYASQPASEIGLSHVYVRLGYGTITHDARIIERLPRKIGFYNRSRYSGPAKLGTDPTAKAWRLGEILQACRGSNVPEARYPMPAGLTIDVGSGETLVEYVQLMGGMLLDDDRDANQFIQEVYYGRP
ncbi:hypothetical protein LTR49_017993 [Elasticomyces elasticus]|nr:hypothetical protein LTR49_017993 [Elasticomyces elasticus]